MYQREFIKQVFNFQNWKISESRFEEIRKKYYSELDLAAQYNAKVIIDTLRFSGKKDLFLQSMNAKYHDLGRINDEADIEHGSRGAILMEKMDFSWGKEKLRIYQAVIAAHSLGDEAFETEWKRWENQTGELIKGRNLLEILKDADALDRFRLRDQSLRLDFLHKDISFRTVQGAYELYHLFPEI